MIKSMLRLIPRARLLPSVERPNQKQRPCIFWIYSLLYALSHTLGFPQKLREVLKAICSRHSAAHMCESWRKCHCGI